MGIFGMVENVAWIGWIRTSICKQGLQVPCIRVNDKLFGIFQLYCPLKQIQDLPIL